MTLDVDLYPLIATKIRPPQRQQTLLRRQRLVDFIHGNIEHKLILVSAGAGYGKTSLLIDYAHDTELPICWYSLDASDAYVPTFIEYLVASIRRRFPRFGTSVLEALRAYSGPYEAVEPFVKLLLSEIDEVIDQYFVIILDDYHAVLDSEPVNALVDGLLRYLPDHCHLILASRGIPRRLTLTRLAARQEIVGLGVNHLRFTEGEIRELLPRLGWLDLSPEQISFLAERSEGWVTGILLAAQANLTGTLQDILQLSGTMEGVFNYLAQEVLGRQSPETQRFLLGSALFSQMSPPLCDALLDIDDSAQMLRWLYEQSLFTFRLDSEGNWYHYHQLFREFLVAKLEEDSERYRLLCLRQAQVMAHQGNWAQAIHSYLSAQAFDQAADAIEIIAQETFDSGDRELLRSWIDALPGTLLSQHPRLLLSRAKVHAEVGEWEDADAVFHHAYRSYMARHDDLGAARALAQLSTVQRLRERLDDAIRTCHQVLEIVGERDHLAAVEARHNLGVCYHFQGRPAEALAEMAKALSSAEERGDDTNAAFIAHDMGLAEVTRGQLVFARQYFHQALMHWRKIGNPGDLALTLQGLGVVHHHLGQYIEAENRYQESLSKARAVADRRLEAYALINLGDLNRDQGQYDDAMVHYQQALDIASSLRLTRLILYILIAIGDTYRLTGNLGQARQLLVEALDQGDDSSMAYEVGLIQMSIGAVALAQGNAEEAVIHLGRSQELLASAGAKRDLARAHLHLAMLFHSQGAEADLCSHLGEVARLAGELGSSQFIVAEGRSVIAPLQHAMEWGVRGLDYARIRSEIEQIFRPAHADVSAPIVRLESPIQLEFLALNGGQILKAGQVVTDWESEIARVMAFLFVAHPGGLHRDRVITMLWPEVSQAKGNSRFHSTKHRVGRALAADVIIHRDGLYQANPACTYRYDVLEFERFARLGHGDGHTAHLSRAQAIALYHGPFLETCDLEWCCEIRRSLAEEMLVLLAMEADYLARAELPREAEALFVRMLGFDSLDERAHRGIMWCRAIRDDTAGALRQFRECARVLKVELDAHPDVETLDLYHAVRAGHLPPTPS